MRRPPGRPNTQLILRGYLSSTGITTLLTCQRRSRTPRVEALGDRVKSPLLFIFFAFLSGCATYHARPIAPGVLMQAFESRTLEDPDLHRYLTAHCGGVDACAPGVWNLSTLTLAAFYFSPALDVARAQLGVRQAAIQTAGQHPNPTLQLPLGYTSNANAGTSPYTYGLGLDIPIETAGKRGYRRLQAQQLSQAARYHIGNVAWQVRSRLRRHMLALQAATERAQLLGQQITTQQQIVAMLDKRLSVGAVSALEVSQARIALAQQRVDLAQAQQQAGDERARLASVIGLPVAALADIPISSDNFERSYPALPADAVRRQAVLNRADVMQALAQYAASQAALQLEIARQYPDIHLGPGYTFDAGADKFLLPLSAVSLPLFNRNEGPIAEAEARRAQAAAHVNAVQALAINDSARALRNYQNALDYLHLADTLLSEQQQRLRALQKTFQVGETDRLTLALAQHEFYAQTLARQDARVQVQRQIGLLEDAMQRPLSANDFTAVPK